jgi:SAM-dependent methyltransferase
VVERAAEPAVEPAELSQTRAAYDTVADAYEEVLRDSLAGSPWERAVLGLFAELVGPLAPVADLGCGPGRVTGYLATLGLDVFGVDLSPGMIEVARRVHPTLRFEVASMDALALPDASLAGAVAWYSIIHTPPQRLPALFTQIQVGDEQRHITHGYGHAVELDAYRLRPETVAELLADAGLLEMARLQRQPTADEKTPQAYLIARNQAL